MISDKQYEEHEKMSPAEPCACTKGSIGRKYHRNTSRHERMKRNAEYIAKLDRGFEQIASGKGIEHELIEDDE